ncbi:MAG: hypothetical protein MPF33_08705 [Candidatus Aramenus sp.]|jgi:hypothetical protein|nr:hypothetical protein [Candidatus Aramenus sp.]
MKALSQFLFLLLVLPSIASSYSLHVNIHGSGITVMIEEGDNVITASRNETVEVQNGTVYVIAYTTQLGYQVEINGNTTYETQINPNTTNYVNVSLVPIFSYVNITIDGNGEVIVKFDNGSSEMVRNSSLVKVIQGTSLSLTPIPGKGYSFYSWSNLSSMSPMWIIAFGNQSIIAVFVKDNGSSFSLPKYDVMGFGFLGLFGAIYLLNRKKT